jgi:hypothetical protein
MNRIPEEGEKVTWNTAQGETEGEVEKIVTETTSVKGHTAKAAKSRPQVLAKSTKSGKTAIHKPKQLKMF